MVHLKVSKGYPFLVNDTSLTKKFKSALSNTFGSEKIVDIPIRMTAEDFAFYSQKIPVCFFRLGTGFSDKNMNYSVHHPRFDVDINCLKTGILALVLAASLK
jgi:amidohydrolase